MWDIGTYEDVTLCETDEVHLNLKDIFIDYHIVDVKHNMVQFWYAKMAKNWI